jgi:divalent metal cation (Fe/Co/Zn/Cd) transporter
MPLLARSKRRIAVALSSRALVSEAKQTSLCAYLSVIALVGVGLTTFFGLWWADSVAALGMVPIIAIEGIEGVRGEKHCDDCDPVEL